MATLGQCKACEDQVSDEAVSCPKCGQPDPCVLPPLVGTVHRGVVSAVHESSASVTLSTGFVGSLRGAVVDTLRLGDSIHVKVASVNRGFAVLTVES